MSIFKNIFGSKSKPVDYTDLGVDVHSHLIPGIDDGAPDMDATIQMLKMFADLGYKKVITTPHIMSDYYKNTPEIILSGLNDVRQEINNLDVNIEIDAAAEYYLDQHFFKLIKDKNLLTFGDNYVLFELSFNSEPPQVNEVIFELITAGYKPILAHVERYPFYHNDWEKMDEFIRRGCILQLNINSLSGHYGKPTRKMAEQLIEKKLIRLISSDCHRSQHIESLKNLRENQYLSKAFELDLINREL